MENPAPEREREFSPGDACDGYRVLSLIAKGGMGDVYEAVHEATGRIVALKCLKVKHLRKDDARARMKMEAIVLSELQHANLVQVYDAGVNDFGMVWIAMERLDGETLRQVLYRTGRLPVPEALFYASEIAEGVDAVHEVNVIHRDLKPENVFITRRNDVKVLDLGTGKFAGYGLNNTDRMKVVGTTAYMSPEQIKGLRVDARADVYALGLMVYEMIAGRHALARGSSGLIGAPEQIALLQLEAIPPKLSDIVADCPSYVVRIVHRAIAKNRDERHPTMAAFGHELRVARKRFIAEPGLDDPSGRGMVHGERLREKLGSLRAKPRVPSPLSVSPQPQPQVPEADRNAARVDFQLQNTVMDPFRPGVASSHATPPVGSEPLASVPHEATLELSAASEPHVTRTSADAFPGRRDHLPEDVRNRTTNTNPLGLLRPAELTPEPHSFPDLRRRSALWSRPTFRRAALTIGLGALIGIPPAVSFVVWRVHHRAAASQAIAVPQAAPLAGGSLHPSNVVLETTGSPVDAPGLTGQSQPPAAPVGTASIVPGVAVLPARAPNDRRAEESASAAVAPDEPRPKIVGFARLSSRPAAGIVSSSGAQLARATAGAAPVLVVPNFPFPRQPGASIGDPPAPPPVASAVAKTPAAPPSPVTLPPSGL